MRQLALALALLGCDGNVELVVDLRTDMVAGVEVGRVDVEILTGVPGDPFVHVDRLFERELSLSGDLIEGERVAEISIAPGDVTLRARLRSLEGYLVIERPVVVNARASTGITVVVTRDCRGIMCPAPGGDPVATACLAGRCVDPRCLPESTEHCPAAECAADGDCAAPLASCASARCVEGTCLEAADDRACMPGQRCVPDRGCVSAPMADGGLDASADTGVPIDASADASRDSTASDTAVGDAGGDATSADAAVDASADSAIDASIDAGADAGDAGSPLAPPALDWVVDFNGALGNDTVLAVDAAGNAWVVLHYVSPIDLGMGIVSGTVLASYDSTGALRFARALIPVGGEVRFLDAVARGTDDVCFGGWFYGSIDLGSGTIAATNANALIACFGPGGIATRTLVGGGGIDWYAGVWTVGLDAAGRLYGIGQAPRAGSFDGQPFALGSDGYFVAGFDAAGARRFVVAYETNGEQPIAAVSADGTISVALRFYGSLSLGGPALVSGFTQPIAFAQYDAAGAHVGSWAYVATDAFVDLTPPTPQMVALGGRRFCMMGRTNADFGPGSGVDFGSGPIATFGGSFVQCFAADAATWGRDFEPSAEGTRLGAYADLAGRVYVAGQYRFGIELPPRLMTSGFSNVAIIVALADGGAPRWYWVLPPSGSSEYTDVARMAFAPDGSVVAAGYFEGTVDFGDGPRTSSGQSSYLVRFRPEP